MRTTLLLWSLAAASAGCAGPSTATEEPGSPEPAASPDARATGRPGVTPPMYKPSSNSSAPMAITDNAYGAFEVAEGAPQLGDTFPDFELPLADGGTYALAEARGAGPVLVMFYRGFW